MKMSEQIAALAEALAKAQAEITNPTFDKTAKVPTKTGPGYSYKYASLAAVRDAFTPIFARHGLAVTQWPTASKAGVEVHTLLLHTSGQWIEYDPLEMPVSKSDAQGVGSAITYGRRYALLAVANIVADDDDDGQAAVRAAPQKRRREEPAAQDEEREANHSRSAELRNELLALITAARTLEELRGVVGRAKEQFQDMTPHDEHQVRTAYATRKAHFDAQGGGPAGPATGAG